MPIPIDELSVFFDRYHDDLRQDWERRVEQGSMSDWTRQRHEMMMDEIAMILRMLAEGHAMLAYVRSMESGNTRPMPRIKRGGPPPSDNN